MELDIPLSWSVSGIDKETITQNILTASFLELCFPIPGRFVLSIFSGLTPDILGW